MSLFLTRACRRHKTSFWGKYYFVTPALVDWIHGDGLQVISIIPLATRPDYYIARIDSKVSMDNCGDKPRFVDKVLDDLIREIEIQYGEAIEDWEHENGRIYTRNNWFPAWRGDYGCAWEQMMVLKSSDKRTAEKVRRDILRSKAK